MTEAITHNTIIPERMIMTCTVKVKMSVAPHLKAVELLPPYWNGEEQNKGLL